MSQDFNDDYNRSKIEPALINTNVDFNNKLEI